MVSFVESFDGVSIAYESHGKGSPAVVLVHGGMCNRTHWEKQVAALAPTYQVVTLDLAGHGESGAERDEWTILNWAKDVKAVVTALDLKQVVLAGHSLGAPVVVDAARLMPDRTAGVVAVDGVVYVVYSAIRDPEVVNGELAPFRANFKAATEAMVREQLFAPTSDPALIQRCIDDMTSMPPEIGLPLLETLYDWGSEEALPHVSAPVQCIVSGVLFDARKALGLILPVADQLKVKAVPNVGHWVMLEDPETFNALLLESIDEMVA